MSNHIADTEAYDFGSYDHFLQDNQKSDSPEAVTVYSHELDLHKLSQAALLGVKPEELHNMTESEIIEKHAAHIASQEAPTE